MKTYTKCFEIAQIIFLVCSIALAVRLWISTAIAVGLSGERYSFDVSTYYLTLGICSIIVLVLQVVKIFTVSIQSMNWLGWCVPVIGIVTAIAQAVPYIMFVKMSLNDSFTINRFDVFIVMLVLGMVVNSILLLWFKRIV